MFHNGNRIEIEARFNFSHLFIELYSYIKTIYMSNDRLFNISIGYMPYCSINGWDVSMERRDVVDYRSLAST